MFVRYLGGGIGHLEQFPPANNDDGVMHEHEDNEDDGMVGDADRDGGNQDDEEDDGDEEDDEDVDDEDGNDEDEEGEDGEAGEGDEYSDPGESSDEETGNVY